MVFLDLDYLLTRDAIEADRSVAIGMSVSAQPCSWCTANGARGYASSAHGARPEQSARPMSEDVEPTEPSAESLEEIPEQDFSRAIRPNRYANLRGTFQHAVFVDREIWEHFGSPERIVEVLRLLVDIARRRSA